MRMRDFGALSSGLRVMAGGGVLNLRGGTIPPETSDDPLVFLPIWLKTVFWDQTVSGTSDCNLIQPGNRVRG